MPRDEETGFQISEAEAAARWLIDEKKVPPEHIVEEAASLDTIGNAFWFRTLHLEPMGFYKEREEDSEICISGRRSVTIFTSRFHYPRTSAL